LIFVVVVVVLMAAMAIPLLNRVAPALKLRGAVSSVTGAIQSTRYQAIFQGCPYQLVFAAAANTYQVQRQCPAGGAFTNYCVPAATSCPIPLSGSGTPVTLNGDIILTFSPGGKVTSPGFPGGGINMVLSYGGRPPETISISTYGSINVNP
jgi:type II secretory pathway pseudopilin PulG